MFWQIFGVFGGKVLDVWRIFVVESRRSTLTNFFRVKKVKLAIARILLFLQAPQLSKLLQVL